MGWTKVLQKNINTTQFLLSKHFPINWAHISQFFSYRIKAGHLFREAEGKLSWCEWLELCPAALLLPPSPTPSTCKHQLSLWIRFFQGNPPSLPTLGWWDFWDVTMFEFYVAAWSSCGLWNLKWVLLGRDWVGWFTKFSLAMSSRVVGRPLSRETTRLHQESWPLAKLWVFHLKQEKSETQGMIHISRNI